MSNAPTLRSQSIRQVILRIVHNCCTANPDAVVLTEQICNGFAGRVPPGEAEVREAICDLLDDALIVQVPVPTMSLIPTQGYRTTKRGRDFWRAGCPWDRLDAFSRAEDRT